MSPALCFALAALSVFIGLGILGHLLASAMHSESYPVLPTFDVSDGEL